MQKQIAVIGAGAVGLSTAVQIQKLIPTANIVIIADKFARDTTSYGAAGIFRPTLSKTPGVPLPLLRTWLGDSWQHYDSLAHSPDAGLAGIQITSGFQFVTRPDPNILEEEFVYQYRRLSDKELNMFPGDRYQYGWFVTTMVVDPSKYLPYLTDRFVENGGKLESKKLSSFEELVGQFDVVVNCTGLGSQQLLSDSKMVPNRGHIVTVKAPWLKHFVYTGEDGLLYIIPGLEFVHIGGTRTDNDVDLQPRPEDTQRIMADACRVVPSLKNAEIVREWVGLRPTRNALRVEKELRQFDSGSLRLVHNYGHGAEGISLSWGTGTHAAQLVAEFIID
jgi:glycine/D-amino acid oxidase-like deaminating enzyme